MLVTPAFLKAAMEFHVEDRRTPTPNTPGSIIKELVDAEFIREKESGGEYMATDRLAAWVSAICKVPFPVKKWMVEWPKSPPT